MIKKIHEQKLRLPLMSNSEIKKYLEENNYQVHAQDGIINILNTSHQIIDIKYISDSKMMTLVTPDYTFEFIWILGNL